jgi:hypothetical protein
MSAGTSKYLMPLFNGQGMQVFIEEIPFLFHGETVFVGEFLRGHNNLYYFKLSNPSINLMNAPSVRSTGVA